jgi:hypothetical protein
MALHRILLLKASEMTHNDLCDVDAMFYLFFQVYVR